MNDLLNVRVGDYTVIQSHDGRLHTLRHGEEWRDCVGDGLICALAHEVERLRTDYATLLKAWGECVIALETVYESDREMPIVEISPTLRRQIEKAVKASRVFAAKGTP